MQRGSIVKGATYQTTSGDRFRVTYKGKSTIVGRWVDGPLKGQEARIAPYYLKERTAEGQS